MTCRDSLVNCLLQKQSIFYFITIFVLHPVNALILAFVQDIRLIVLTVKPVTRVSIDVLVNGNMALFASYAFTF